LNLINNGNLHEGWYLKRSPKLTVAISPVIDLVRATLARGAATGDFRADVDALDCHVTLAAMRYYPVSNRFTPESVFRTGQHRTVGHRGGD
jgi:hypothetical protein